jgi:hypothetical protein
MALSGPHQETWLRNHYPKIVFFDSITPLSVFKQIQIACIDLSSKIYLKLAKNLRNMQNNANTIDKNGLISSTGLQMIMADAPV